MGRGGGIDCRDVAKEEAEVAKDSRWADWAEERMEQPMVEQEAAKSAVMGPDGVEDHVDSVSTAISCRRSSAAAKALCAYEI